MDFNSALDIIIKDLGDARTIIDEFRKYSEIPSFQIELAKSKCKSAAEMIALLKEIPKTGNEVKENAPARVSPEIIAVPVIPDPYQVEEKVVKEEPAAAVLEIITPEPEPVVTSERVAGKEKPHKQHVHRDKHDQKEIIADRFTGGQDRVSEKVKPLDPEADFTSRLMKSKIDNLADAVGVNDKFYFIREIFGGDSHSYNDAIGKLNSASGVREAREILDSYTGGSGNEMAINDLLSLVKRKTGNDE